MVDNTVIVACIVSLVIIFAIMAALAGVFLHRRFKVKKEESKKDLKQVKNSQTSRHVPISSIINGNVPQPSLEEFDNLIRYDGGISQRFTTAQGLRYNKSGQLNLVTTNLPFDHNRIKLKTPIQGCDYVNASWITPPSDDNATYDELIYTSYLPFNRIQFAVGQEAMPHYI